MYSVLILLPIAKLALLNRFCFGKVVCTTEEDGLHLEDKIIEWSTIK